MARYDHLPLWRDAAQLAVLLEGATSTFPRAHKYTLGSELRRQALAVCRGIIRASTATRDRVAELEVLVLAVEELKLLIQMGKELRAFRSFRQFEEAAVLAVAIGRQSGGWWKKARSEVRPTVGAGASQNHCAPMPHRAGDRVKLQRPTFHTSTGVCP